MAAAPLLSRRQLLHTAATLGALRLVLGSDAFAAPVKPLTEAWAKQVGDLAGDYRRRSLTQPQWQQAIAELNRRIPIDELLSYIDFDRLQPMLQAQGAGEHFERIRLPGLEASGHRIWTAVFILPEGDAIPPHAHNNLATAHLVLKGRFRARTFDRVQDAPGHMLLTPRLDAAFLPGDTVSMTDDQDNAHWFIAENGPVFTFDISIRSTELRQYQNPMERDGRIFIDPGHGRRSDGLVEAAVIDHATSLDRYGSAAKFLLHP